MAPPVSCLSIKGLTARHPVNSPASLVAEWFEYTPTHGTDIEVNTAAAKTA